VRLPAASGLVVAARGTWPLASDARPLAALAVTIGGELELGPRGVSHGGSAPVPRELAPPE